MLRFTLAFCLFAQISAAETVLSPQQFEAFSQGKTLYFSQAGQPYGAEQYLPNRQSIWQYADGSCHRGIWFTRKDQICVIYENNPEEQCWNFLDKDGVFAARAIGNPPEADLVVSLQDTAPLICLGPEIGA